MYKKLFLSLLLFLITTKTKVVSKKRCGGVFREPRGVLSTPNFPGPFPVPLDCKWVIDATNFQQKNFSIVVYLSQLFVFEGLKFTEHQFYEEGFQMIEGNVIHVVNDSNISKVKWVQTYQEYLVIELSLQTADSAHLRVLDKFLDIFGFNITYEITTRSVRNKSCTMMDCGFTGVCYDHYTKFSCDCFPGYTGPHCSDGPKSLCSIGGVPRCKNGATCIHVGASAVKCHCSKGYKGLTCDVLDSSTYKDCENCLLTCPYDGNLENACKCQQHPNATSGDIFQQIYEDTDGDRKGYATTMHFSNLPKIEDPKLKLYIKNQIQKTLQKSYPNAENITIDSLVHFLQGVDVTFHFFGMKKDEKRIKSVLMKWVERGNIGNITILDKEFNFRTMLSLQKVTDNHHGSMIRVNDEVILSCVAKGPPNMTFRWFKDNIYIDVTDTRYKWTRLIQDQHETDKYTALLGIKRAEILDDGLFTCQVEDLTVQQCMSLRVKVGRPPPILTIKPMSITVRKGDNFTVQCLILDENTGNYTYSWTKNRVLLPINTPIEKYEVLYPSGSILQVFNAEKDVEYSCLVQGETTKSEEMVYVYVVDRENVHTCPENFYMEINWPETAPDTNSVQHCPKNYSGSAFRSCSLRDGRKPAWSVADFSKCTHTHLDKLQKQFELLKLGYMNTKPETLLQGFLEYTSTQNIILPGEGAKILSLTKDVISFVSQSKLFFPIPDITVSLFSIVGKVMLHENSLVKQEQVDLIQQLLRDHLTFFATKLIDHNSTFHLNFSTIDFSVQKMTTEQRKFHVPLLNESYETWFGIRLKGNYLTKLSNTSEVVSVVVFKNISAFLPPRSFIRLRDGSEMAYQLFSQIVNIWVVPESTKARTIMIDFRHEGNWTGVEDWSIRCASTNYSSFNMWNINDCETNLLNDSATRCICSFSGTFALLLTTTPATGEGKEVNPQRYILVAGCSLCMVLALFTTVCLVTTCWTLRHSCLIFLKLQCSVSILGAGIIFTFTTIEPPQQASFKYINPILEILLLMAMSSHLSKLLIVFTELVQLPRPVTSKQTVIGIISGVPIITVFGSHLAYRTMDIKLKSWWMTSGSLAFYIYVTVSSIITILFIFIHFTVMKKLNALLQIHEKQAKPILKRMALLRRAGCIFSGVAALSVSSIIYVNMPNAAWSLYQFSVVNIILGIILMVCYVAKAETEFRSLFKSSTSINKDDKFFSVDSTILTKQEAELENECGAQMKPDIHRNTSSALGECHRMMDTISKTQISATFESCLHNSTSFCDGHDDVSSTPRKDKQDGLEKYNSSPQQFRKYNSSFATNSKTMSRSPDILSSKVCVELDLVASSLHTADISKSPVVPARRMTYPKLIVTPDEAIAKILESDNSALSSERTQPDGIERVIANCEVVVTEPPPPLVVPSTSGSDKLDGMLDSISQDLDYLLNRSEEVDAPVQVSTLRKISKPPAASVIHQIREESEEDDLNIPEAITDILRTDC